MLRKIAVTLDPNTVADLDRWVREGRYPNRSRALQSAVDYFAKSDKRNRLVRELNKLDRAWETAHRQFQREGKARLWRLARDCHGDDSAGAPVEMIIAEDQHRTNSRLFASPNRVQVGPVDLSSQ